MKNITYGFVVHTFEKDDLSELAPTLYKKDRKHIEKNLLKTPPQKIAEFTNLVSAIGTRVDGVIISTWLFPNQYFEVPSNVVYKRIQESVRIAEKEGARIVGLGGYNSIVPVGAGLRISRSSRVGITNGNSYTIYSSYEATIDAVQKMGLQLSDLSVMVLGATGSIGSVISELMAMEKPKKLTLVARNMQRLKGRAKTILDKTGYQSCISNDVKASLETANVVISATSAPDEVINSIKPGTIVCDVAVPHDVSESVINEREDVIVFEGGLSVFPSTRYKTKPDLPNVFGLLPHETYACFSETAILAMEGEFNDFSLEGITIDNVKKIGDLSKKHGFKIAKHRNQKEKPIQDKKFQKIGELIKKNLH